MAQDTIKFVDSIAASPTTRLDVNDGTIWRTRKLSCPPPRLRRAMSSNAMSDGVFVSSSAYDSRVVTLELALVHTSEDNAATEWQKLARELDRTDNFLMYQPTGATKPVFFRTFRSDIPSLEQFTGGSSAFKQPTVEILAEPFALGLRETIGPFTVNNDPAAGSNGLFFDVTGVIGDVAAPAVIKNTSGLPDMLYLGVRQQGTPSNLVFFVQAESITLDVDTTNPGGGPDAAMSGAGTNNFVRTSFATDASMRNRIIWDTDSQTDAQRIALRGRFRVLVCYRRSDATSVINVQASKNSAFSAVTATALSTARQLVDLGVQEFGGSSAPARPGAYSVETPVNASKLAIYAQRVSGTGTIDWDYILLLPADSVSLTASGDSGAVTVDSVLDGELQQYYAIEDAGDPFGGACDVYEFSTAPVVSGGFPKLLPNVTNRFIMAVSDVSPTLQHVKTATNAMTVYYWPRYLYIRPSAT